MTISPGWGGQPFIERSPEKIARLRALLDGAAGPVAEGGDASAVVGSSDSAWTALEVDGGIDPGTAPLCRARGATMFVAGSAIFGSDQPGQAYSAIADAIDAV
jgi:ribulose-phosphate 3-epimerase